MALQFGSMAYVSIEGKGKAAGGRTVLVNFSCVV